jgi:hypothetical protein
MTKIRHVDMRFLDDVFEMQGGYVLDFSDRTFAEFFRSELTININDRKYFQGGTSKAKRLRTFLQMEKEPLVARSCGRSGSTGTQSAVHSMSRTKT